MEQKMGVASGRASKNVFREIWAVSESKDNSREETSFSLGLKLGVVAVILVAVVFLVAWLAIKRSELAMTNLLEEKGASLLISFESALRTSIKDPESSLKVQTLFEEVAESPDIIFIAVVMPDGTILAHSDRSRIGEIMTMARQPLTSERIAAMNSGAREQSLITYAEHRPVFLVYRNFPSQSDDWPDNMPKPLIFLGLDVAPFDITRNQNRNYVIILSVVICMLGLTGLLVMSFAQKAARSRFSQKKAENAARHLAEEVRRSEKMAAIGTLAAGVAHEIRNPLSSIKGYATYFLQRFAEGSEEREAAGVMVAEVDRLNRVITDLLGLSNQSSIKIKPVKLQNVLFHVSKLLRKKAADHHVKISLREAPQAPLVECDMEKLSQALLNLCLNSIEAMPHGGLLTLAVSGGKDHVCIMAADTGDGISADILPMIFDPYFTTKNSGTGLGLPMVHKIVAAHNGRIKVSSRMAKDGKPGRTIFYIWLPVLAKRTSGSES